MGKWLGMESRLGQLVARRGWLGQLLTPVTVPGDAHVPGTVASGSDQVK
ncbi:hypothetical protein [Nocardia testacea]